MNYPVIKTLDGNLDQRGDIVERCENNVNIRKSVLAMCHNSCHFWLNMFCFTYRPKITCWDGVERSAGTAYKDEFGKMVAVPPADTPLITWPAQDGFVDEILHVARYGGLLLGDKSREQGFTVVMMATLAWCILFWNRFSALVISRKADLVDAPGEDSLLGRVDYIISKLPKWMVPPIRRTHKPPLIINKKLGSRIIGESANEDVGQSFRTNVTFVDEASRFPHAEALMKSIESVSAGQILGSTPNGPGTIFSKLCRKARDTEEGRKHMRIFQLGYWDHPQKGLNRHVVVDHDGLVTGKIGSRYWETPAFELSRSKSTSPRDWRENWLVDHETSGLQVIDSRALSLLRPGCFDPVKGHLDVEGLFDRDGNCVLNTEKLQRAKKVFRPDAERGRLSLWCDLDPNTFAPRMNTNYVIGCDFAQGVESSQTVIAVMDRTSGEIVAEYVDPSIAPHEAVYVAEALGYWFGGQMGTAFITWEANGPGLSFGAEMFRRSYPFMYYRRDPNRAGDPPIKGKLGWWSTQDTKQVMFSNLSQATREGTFITYCEDGVDEMAAWIFDDQGKMVCGTLRDQSTGAQARHGDRAIGYGLCVFARSEAPSFEKQRERFPVGSTGNIAGLDELFEEDDDKNTKEWYL